MSLTINSYGQHPVSFEVDGGPFKSDLDYLKEVFKSRLGKFPGVSTEVVSEQCPGLKRYFIKSDSGFIVTGWINDEEKVIYEEENKYMAKTGLTIMDDEENQDGIH